MGYRLLSLSIPSTSMAGAGEGKDSLTDCSYNTASMPVGGSEGTEKDSATVKKVGSTVDEANQLTRKRLRDPTPLQQHSVSTEFTSEDGPLLLPAKEAKRPKNSSDSPDNPRPLSDLSSVHSGTSPIPKSCSDATVNVTASVEKGSKGGGEFSPCIPLVPDDPQLAKTDPILSSSQGGSNGTDPHQPFQPESKSCDSNRDAGNKEHGQKTGSVTAHSSQGEHEGKTDTNKVCLHCVACYIYNIE